MIKKSIFIALVFSISFIACNLSNNKNDITENQKNILDSLRIDSAAREIKTKIENAINAANSDTL